MRLGRFAGATRATNEGLKLLVDTNIFLEVQLSQRRAPQARAILASLKSPKKRGFVTDITMDSIAIIMEHHGRTPEQVQVFLTSLLGYAGLEFYYLSLFDRIAATSHMKQFGLDYDDACQYQAMKVLEVGTIASFDADFDRIPEIKRITSASELPE